MKIGKFEIRWLQSAPFLFVHIMPFFIFLTGSRLNDWLVCIALYWSRMFFITAGYHRYFSHRSYKMGRVMQFLMAFGGGTCAQRGVLWWAAHHRQHHKASDSENDPHQASKGLYWSHIGWLLAHNNDYTDSINIEDLKKYPELVWMDKYFFVPPAVLALACLLIGGPSMLIVGFFLSTVIMWHGTFTINSLSHYWGRVRYNTGDTSRNNPFLAFITMGEGWHNNHHHYQASARQGFFWWEFDFSFYILWILSKVGLVSRLTSVPEGKLHQVMVNK